MKDAIEFRSDPAAQAKNVGEAVAAFQEHKHWEDTHPGQLWNSPGRKVQRIGVLRPERFLHSRLTDALGTPFTTTTGFGFRFDL
jgi:hypothetical protein